MSLVRHESDNSLVAYRVRKRLARDANITRSPAPACAASGCRARGSLPVEDLIDPRETRPYLWQFIDAMGERLEQGLGLKMKSDVRP